MQFSSLSLFHVLCESARLRPQRTALICGSDRVSYVQLWKETQAFADVLRSKGVRAGDRVALLMPNTPDFARAYYAILSLGAVVVPVHGLLTPEEVAYVVRDSQASLLIRRSLKDLEVFPTAEITERQSDDAVILYTSGTTGKPKGAVLTHLNMVMNATVSAQDLFGYTEEDVLLCALPLFHSFGQSLVMNAGFRAGSAVVLMPKFDGAAALDLIVRENVSVFVGVPTMYIALLEAAKTDPRRPKLRRLISGGASLPVAVLERVRETFGCDIEEGYGLSETSPAATFNQRAVGLKPGTVGTPIWGVEVGIARAEVEDRFEWLPPGERGEVVIRGHCVFSRYLNKPEATAAAKIDGWFRSGDIGVIDADGFLSIVDRKKELIIRGGFNVYPREIEEVLTRHPAIALVAVIGVPDDVFGEEVCAVVIPRQQIPAEEIISWARERLGKHKYPRRVEFVEAFPLGPSGKVLKRVLADRFR
jgi:long-chain acyl-CoA synthetase